MHTFNFKSVITGFNYIICSIIPLVAPPRPDPPRSVRLSATGTTTVTFVWVAPVASVGNRIATYNLVLTESGGATTFTRSVTGTSHTFTGLQEYRTYSCVITAVSIYGPVSVPTAPVSGTTQQAGRSLTD